MTDTNLGDIYVVGQRRAPGGNFPGGAGGGGDETGGDQEQTELPEDPRDNPPTYNPCTYSRQTQLDWNADAAAAEASCP